MNVIHSIAAHKQAPILQFGRDFWLDNLKSGPHGSTFTVSGIFGTRTFVFRDLKISMLGAHQAENAAVAIAAAAWLESQGFPSILENLNSAVAGFHHAGRIQVLHSDPTVIVDVAHNVASAQSLMATLHSQVPAWLGDKRRWLILSVSHDKDVRGICRELVPHFDEVVITQFQQNPRARPAAKLASIAEACKLDRCGLERSARPTRIHVIPSPAEAWNAVREQLVPGDVCCVTGSLFLVAELAALIGSTLWDRIEPSQLGDQRTASQTGVLGGPVLTANNEKQSEIEN